jgi:hypothetical protein
MDDLHRVFGELARSVPDGPVDKADFIFDKRVLPNPPPKLLTERIVLRKTHHEYNGCYRADLLLMFVEPDASRELGVFLLACVFHEPERVTLELPQISEIRRIVYRSPNRGHDSVPVGLRQSPTTFRYFPGHVAKHPWMAETNVSELPLLALSSLDESPVSAHDWEGRDTVFVRSSSAGTVRLAELLLNAGCSWNEVREYELEGDAGFRGVAPLSAELSIALPGSDLWISHPGRTRAGA